ncbi:MAG: NosD domain-containing protein, partial [Promethearchaeota archaeon]
GIGDIPYIISGSAGSIDHFPIWDDGVDIIPIIIDDLGYGDYTWEEAATEEWCSGSGTYSNPYVIENLVFLSYDGYIIEIRNSNAYFIIKNCGSSGINHGIYLENVRNAIIKNNELNGIYMDNCKLIEIKDNLITLNNVYLYNCNFINIKGNYITEVNTESILLTESSFNLITNNEITNNQGEGIRFEYRCMFNVIRDNIITECWGTGIFMEELCNYNIISGNYINSIHGSGIVLDACYKNLILNNTISENNFDGIALYSCGDSLITKNLIKYHEQYGISLVECFNIKVSENIAKYIDDYAICIEIGNDIVILKNKIQSEMGIGLYEATNCQIIYNSIKSVNIGPIDGINMLFCEYALISGNTIIQYAIGMDIEHSNNTIISNNIITKSNEIALFLDNSYGNSISNNILSENMFGIEMFYCGDSIITENFIENHDQYSISLIDCYGIEISDNDIRVNEDYGIVIEYCESDISILNNKIHYGSGGGIVLGISNNALVKGNYINNPMSEGIILEESNNNKVLKNIIIRAEGIILTGSCNNFISGNIITSEDNEFETIGIWIESESNYNIICKNYISQLTAGILIDNCQGNKISNNLLNCNLYYGLRMDYSNFNTINNNIVIGNEDFGFYFYQSNNNSVSGNFIRNNAITGICLTHSNHNVVSFNTIIENKIGIMIEEGGYDNSLIGNFVSRSFNEGIYLVECNNNIISGNMVRDNSWDGINVAASSDNIITKNFIISNGMIGLRVQLDSTNNIIYQNYFVENLLGNAIDDGVNNYWDNGEIGNYWDDYTGVDENNDGIGDTPYNIPGLAGNKDYYPIWEDNYTWYESFDVLYYHKPKPKAIN